MRHRWHFAQQDEGEQGGDQDRQLHGDVEVGGAEIFEGGIDGQVAEELGDEGDEDDEPPIVPAIAEEGSVGDEDHEEGDEGGRGENNPAVREGGEAMGEFAADEQISGDGKGVDQGQPTAEQMIVPTAG